MPLDHIYISLSVSSAFLDLLTSTDAYYFALLPIVEQTASQFGINPVSTAYSMVIGNIVGTFVSPFSPALWLAIGLAEANMGTYIKYAFFWIWDCDCATGHSSINRYSYNLNDSI